MINLLSYIYKYIYTVWKKPTTSNLAYPTLFKIKRNTTPHLGFIKQTDNYLYNSTIF